MSDQYVGEIRMFAGNYPPKGWAFCDGSTLPINGNEALYSIIGVTYGGDGQNSFKLPDLRGRIPVHRGGNSTTGSTFMMGQQGGVEKVTLTSDQLPTHTHQVNAQLAPGTLKNPSNAFWATSNTNQYAASTSTTIVTPNAKLSSQSISTVGGGQAHDNMMPYLTVSFIIALSGLYPVQG